MGIRMRRRLCAAHSGGRTAELLQHSDASKAMRGPQRRTHSGVLKACGCDKGNAQPTAAHALQSDDILFGVWMRQGNTQPTAAHVLQGDDTLRHSAATKQCAAHSGVRTAEKRNSSHCSDATRRQHAAHSGARAAKRRDSAAFGRDKGSA